MKRVFQQEDSFHFWISLSLKVLSNHITCESIPNLHESASPALTKPVMPDDYTQDQTFDKTDFTGTPLLKGEYEACIFTACNFLSTDLSNYRFTECEFTSCNLSLTKLSGTNFQNTRFRNCKMLGLHFDTCSPFGLSFSFEDCQVNHSSFYKTGISKTVFRATQLHETDFTDADLTGVVFDNCDLLRATFDNTVLERADLRTAFNYSIDPERNRLKKARFSLPEVVGLLNKYDIIIER